MPGPGSTPGGTVRRFDNESDSATVFRTLFQGHRWPPGRVEEGGPMRSNRRFVLGATVLSLAIVLAACSKSGGGVTTSGGSNSPSQSPQQKGTLTVGVSGAFAENQIVAEMYAQVLEKAGYTVTR